MIDGHMLRAAATPKAVGLTFDQTLTVPHTCKHLRLSKSNKLKTKNNTVKSLAGSNRGKDKETIVTAYKTIDRTVPNYATPIWSPQLTNIHWNSLQTCQNSAIRIATGGDMM